MFMGCYPFPWYLVLRYLVLRYLVLAPVGPARLPGTPVACLYPISGTQYRDL